MTDTDSDDQLWEVALHRVIVFCPHCHAATGVQLTNTEGEVAVSRCIHLPVGTRMRRTP